MLLLGLIVGLQLGYYAQLIIERLKELVPNTPPSTGVTRGSYNEPHTHGRSGAIVTPKTPQQVEFDVAEDLKRMNGR